MANLSAAKLQMNNRSQWVNNVFDEVDPNRWTKRIEGALGKTEELEYLRVQYDEKALSGISAWLSQEASWHNICDGNQQLCTAIREVLVAYDAIDSKAQDRWLKEIMQTRCVEAAEVHRQDVSDRTVDDRSSVFTRAYNILVQAFTALHADVTRRGRCRAYTTDLVVPGRKYQKFLNASVDLRHVNAVEFIDCVNSKHPASQKLSQLMAQLETLNTAARLAESRLKGGQNPYDKDCSKINSGTINERQHANRLMDALHGQSYECVPSEKQVADQNERRRLYEGVRQEVLIAQKQLQALYEELCETQHGAIVETQQLLGEIQADRSTTIDRWQTVRICMNNCLAADLRLRWLGGELQNLQNVYNKDLSQGAGKTATEAQFAEVERRYRPFKLTGNSGGSDL